MTDCFIRRRLNGGGLVHMICKRKVRDPQLAKVNQDITEKEVNEKLLTPEQAATLLHLKPTTLARWRWAGSSGC